MAVINFEIFKVIGTLSEDKDGWKKQLTCTSWGKYNPKFDLRTVTCGCGNTFKTGSVKEDLRVDVCSKCHPFFTGQQRAAQARGRIEQFNKRYGK